VWDLVSQPGWWIGDGNPANRTIVQEGESTLVELFLTEQGGGTLLRVIESGFASLAIPAQDRESAVEDNINGWEQQLGRDPGGRSTATDTGMVLAALADPTRRALLDVLIDAGRASATTLAGALPVSRQAVVKHLRWTPPLGGSPTCPTPGTSG